MVALRELAERWLIEAGLLRSYGALEAATACEKHVAELREALRSHEREELSLTEAALASGYSVEHLRHLIAAGTIQNRGRKGAPRIWRTDLPLKPGHDPGALAREAGAIAGRIGSSR